MVAGSQTWSGASLLHQQPCRPYNEFGANGTCLCLPKSGLNSKKYQPFIIHILYSQQLSDQQNISSVCTVYIFLSIFHCPLSSVFLLWFYVVLFLVCICRLDHVRNTDVSSPTCLGPVLDPIVRHRSSLFGHVVRLSCPPRLAVSHRSVTWSPSRPKLEAMSRPPSEQVAWTIPQGQHYSTPHADLWRWAVTCGHSEETLQSSITMH